MSAHSPLENAFLMIPSRILITGNMGYVGPGVEHLLRQSFPTAELIGYDLGLFAHCLTGASRAFTPAPFGS